MKRKVLAFFLMAAVVAGGALFFKTTRPEQRQALLRRKAATYVLARYLAEQFPHQHVLIASNPFTQLPGRPKQIYQFEAAGLDGLREGFGDKLSYKTVFPELRPGAREHPENLYVDPQTSTPLSFLLADDAFDKLFAENPEYKICATLIGLPSNLSQTESWRRANLKFALLLPDWSLIGNPETIQNAFRTGKIAAAVVNRPDLALATPINDRDYKNIFEQSFLLITSANCDELMNHYRKLF